MNVLIVGYGSIGQRHARLYRQLGCRVGVVTRRLSVVTLPESEGYATLEAAMQAKAWDIIVIANRTSEHLQTLEELARWQYTGDILVEKPIFDRPVLLSLHDEMRIYVAYNLRFHPIIAKLRELIEGQRLLSAQMYVGQYLPTWRPGRDYTQNYSVSKAAGGGVLRDLSHELDLIQVLFGSWCRLTAIGGKYSHLQGDSDDLFSLLIETDRCPMINVSMNYLDRISQREIIINTDQLTMKADLVKGSLQINQEDVTNIQLDRDSTYLSQHIAMMKRDYRHLCSYTEGLEVVKIIYAAEKAATERTWVYADDMHNLC
jgi:predicted dehydrogenase